MAGDDSQDDGERTRIGGLPPPVPKAPQAPAATPPAAAPAAEEPAERTVIAPARPPGVPPAAPAPPVAPSTGAPAASDDPGERTMIAPARPPGVPPAAAAAPPAPSGAPAAPAGDDRTRMIAAPPPGTARPAPPAAAPAAAAPPSPAAPPAAPPPAAARPAPVGDVTVDPARPRPAAAPDDEERTVVLAPRKVESTMRLERTAPKGTAETIQLDRPSLLLGRGHGCDVKLRTPTASREHGKIFFKNGQWMIAGVEGKSFYVDGTRQTAGEVALKGGMKLRLGDDEFEVVDTAGGAPSRSGGGLWARLTAFVRGLFGRRT